MAKKDRGLFRLGPEHIGKKVRSSAYQQLEYLIPISFTKTDYSKHPTLDMQFIQMKDGRSGISCSDRAERSIGVSRDKWGGDLTEWEFYSPKDGEIFDFSLFGCQEGNVRSLIKVLDNRYMKKGDE